MKRRQHATLGACILAGILGLAATAQAASIEEITEFTLDFSNYGNVTRNASGTRVPANNGDRPITSTNSLRFTNPGTSGNSSLDVDIVFTAVSAFGNYTHTGLYPNYLEANGGTEPNQDLGFRYQWNAGTPRAGGAIYTLEFFEKGTNNPVTLERFSLLIYDVDGSSPDDGHPNQTEAVRVFMDDGFAGYLLGKPDVNGYTMTATFEEYNGMGTYLIQGPGHDVPESSSAGASLLYFENTNKITLQMEANSITGNSVDPIFTAIGDLSILGENPLGKLQDFVAVPEPAAAILLLLGGAVLLRRKRSRTLKNI